MIFVGKHAQVKRKGVINLTTLPSSKDAPNDNFLHCDGHKRVYSPIKVVLEWLPYQSASPDVVVEIWRLGP